MTAPVKPNLIPFVIISTVALPLLVAGIISFSSPELLPWQSSPGLTWSLLGVGILMDVVAVVVLLAELRRVGQLNGRNQA